MGAKELPSVFDDHRLGWREPGEFPLVAQVVHQFVTESRPATEGGVRIPNELAVHFPGGHQHSQFANVCRQAGLVATQIGAKVLTAFNQFGHMNHN